jgi:hypothetical protein
MGKAKMLVLLRLVQTCRIVFRGFIAFENIKPMQIADDAEYCVIFNQSE